MLQNKRTFFLGIFIFLIPFLGLPTSWRTNLVTLCGLLLIAFSLKISLPKKPVKRPRKKEKTEPLSVEPLAPITTFTPAPRTPPDAPQEVQTLE